MNRTKLTLLLVLFSLSSMASIKLEVSPKKKGSAFNSIQSAIEEARRIRLNNHYQEIQIILNEGTYRPAKTINIGSNLSRLSIIAKEGAKVTIRGTEKLNLKWEKHQGNIYKAVVQKPYKGLVVNNQLQTLARFPNYSATEKFWNGAATLQEIEKKIKSYKNPSGVIVNTMHRGLWGGFHYQVRSVNQGKINYTGGTQNNRPSSFHPEHNMIENALEELDSPGEWFCDGKFLYYMPKESEDIKSLDFEGIHLKSIFNVVGSETIPVSNLQFKGINFEFTSTTRFERYEQLLRSDWCMYRGAAMYFENVKNSAIKNCTFQYLGGNAILFSRYNESNTIYGNHLHHIGGSAISFVGDDSAVRSPAFTYVEYVPYEELDLTPGPKSEAYPRNCSAENNLIHDIGTVENQVAGVQIAMAMNISVIHNSIYRLTRAGINVGDGTWGGHIIEYNDVFQTVQASSDHGSFNSWGRDRFWLPYRDWMNQVLEKHPELPYLDAIKTTKIRNNRFKCEHGWDIDLDDGSTNYDVYNNLCLRGGIKFREGFLRRAFNNITVNNGFHPHVWFKNSRDEVFQNIFLTQHRDIGIPDWGKNANRNFYVTEADLKYAKDKGLDKEGAYGDPQFVNAPSGDFRVKADSKALKVGFINFPMNKFGVQIPSLKKIAETPKIPELVFKKFSSKNTKIDFIGAQLKSIQSVDEASAYGLPEPLGVVLLEIGEESFFHKSGFKKGDVIVEAASEKITSVKELVNTYQVEKWRGELKLFYYRNQKKQEKYLHFEN